MLLSLKVWSCTRNQWVVLHGLEWESRIHPLGKKLNSDGILTDAIIINKKQFPPTLRESSPRWSSEELLILLLSAFCHPRKLGNHHWIEGDTIKYVWWPWSIGPDLAKTLNTCALLNSDGITQSLEGLTESGPYSARDPCSCHQKTPDVWDVTAGVDWPRMFEVLKAS